MSDVVSNMYSVLQQLGDEVMPELCQQPGRVFNVREPFIDIITEIVMALDVDEEFDNMVTGLKIAISSMQQFRKSKYQAIDSYDMMLELEDQIIDSKKSIP